MFLRRLVTLLSAGALAAGITTAVAGAARAEVPPDPNWNEIIASFDHNFNNTLCVDDTGHASSGTLLWLWHCNGTGNPNQRWHLAYLGFTRDGFRAYHIELDSTKSGTPLCITPVVDANQPPPQPGLRLLLGSCVPSPAIWIMVTAPGSNPLITLQSGDGTLCMAQADFSDSNGTPLIEKACDPNDLSQVWALG